MKIDLFCDLVLRSFGKRTKQEKTFSVLFLVHGEITRLKVENKQKCTGINTDCYGQKAV